MVPIERRLALGRRYASAEPESQHGDQVAMAIGAPRAI
jgi:hypothetical protein